MLPQTTSVQTTSASTWVSIALLLRPQGRRGELLAEPLSDLPEIFATAHDLILAPANTQTPAPNAATVSIQEHWFPTGKNAGRIVLKLSGCDSISDAEALSGMHLLISSDHLPALDADTFFVGDLIGCDIFDGSTHIGTITDVEFPTNADGRTRLKDAAPLLAVRLTDSSSTDSEPTLIPFIRAWLESVDIPARRLTMHLPAGLIDPSSTPADDTQ